MSHPRWWKPLVAVASLTKLTAVGLQKCRKIQGSAVVPGSICLAAISGRLGLMLVRPSNRASLVRASVFALVGGFILTPLQPAAARSVSGDVAYFDDGTSIEILGCASFECPKNLVVPEKINGRPVTQIGASAFARQQFDSITLPKTLTRISVSAFSDVVSTTAVTIPASVNYFASGSFYKFDAPGLTWQGRKASFGNIAFALVKPKMDLNLTSGEIEEGAFASTSFGSLTIGAAVKLQQNAFVKFWDTDTAVLDSVNISTPVVTASAFRGTEIGSLTLGKTVRVVGSFAFGGGFFGDKVKIGDVRIAAPAIDSFAFTGRTFKSLTLTASVLNVNSDAFSNCDLGAVKVDAVNIANRAFANSSATSVALGKTVQYIGEMAFAANDAGKSLGAVSIAGGVVGPMAFSSTTMTSLNIGSGVSELSSMAFSGGAWDVLDRGPAVVDAAVIGPRAFNNSRFESLTFGPRVRQIGTNACSGCVVNGSISVAAGNLGQYAFYKTTATGITLAPKVTSIAENAFSSADITNVTVESRDIATYAFSGMKVSSLTIGQSVRRIGAYAFSSLSGLTILNFRPGAQSVGGYAFANAADLVSFSFPNTVRYIGDGVLFGASSLTSVNFGVGVQSIGDGVTTSDALTTMTFHGGSSAVNAMTIPNKTGLLVRYPSSQQQTWQPALAAFELTEVSALPWDPPAAGGASAPTAAVTAKTLAFISNVTAQGPSTIQIRVDLVKPPARAGGKSTLSLVCSQQSRMEAQGLSQARCSAPSAFRTSLKKAAATYKVTVTVTPDVGLDKPLQFTMNLKKQ